MGEGREAALRQFYRATRKLREVMSEDDLYLDAFDQVSLENYIALLEMTYIDWKRRHPGSERIADRNTTVARS
jgi:hypothetical protein